MGYLLLVIFISLVAQRCVGDSVNTPNSGGDESIITKISRENLRMFVDELPDMPKLKGYDIRNGVPIPKTLNIGMFEKKWKFHQDLPPTTVFAYGTSKETATVPGPTIEALQGTKTYVTWQNYLEEHILPSDRTIPMAGRSSGEYGIPTVVHLHGGVDEPESDGNPHAWFTSGFKKTGPAWTKKTYRFENAQQPGNLWYHDHAMGLTRINVLAGLLGSYIIRQPDLEGPLGLPSGDEFDRTLVIFDRMFYTNGSLYMNSTGDNPSLHPEWQPSYFGNTIIVNGKIWPKMTVRRRKYRLRLLNGSNARFLRIFFSNGMKFIFLASDSAYISHPVTVSKITLAPSEIADVVVDFSTSESEDVILINDAPYPFPFGESDGNYTGKVMKFFIDNQSVNDTSRVPKNLITYPNVELSSASRTRYITMYEYESESDNPTHMYLNGKSYMDEVTERPKVGSNEIWYVINLSDNNHPLHIHLGFFVTLDQTELLNWKEFGVCMGKFNDAIKCQVSNYAIGRKVGVPAYEKGWKNVFKMKPHFMTKILVRFSFLQSNASYPFDATAEPGYVYHCHILGHEDNEMMRPMKLIP